MSIGRLTADLRAKYGSPVVPAATPVDETTAPEKAFVMTAASGRTVITAPLREVAATNAGFLYLRGRMVGSDGPNANGAYWAAEDLEMGQSTVAGGPVNWLHDENRIIGSLLDGQITTDPEKGAIAPHIVSTMAIWRFLFPEEASVIEYAAKRGELYQSMECVANEVACMTSPDKRLVGCGDRYSYSAYLAGETCAHLRERSSMRRFIDPIFLGTAIIVPPVKPADGQASVELVKQAHEAAERASLDIDIKQAQALAEAVLSWANRA